MGKTAYLVLENGKIFQGQYFGAEGEVTAEVVFTTGMTGYLETLTDRSYYGQIVVQTFPLIGNYGVISSDFESGVIGPRAYIVKDWCQDPSNFRSEGDLGTFLKEKGIVAICGIDTRSLTKIIRETGVMNGMITDDPQKADQKAIREYKIVDAVKNSSVTESYEIGKKNGKYRIALMDYGLKKNIYRKLEEFDATVVVCPQDTTAQQLEALHVQGIMLSNGPGDPEDCTQVIENLRDMLTLNLPIFGICLGHQLLALASGMKTEKLKYGHRGANQPVKDLETGRVYITSQNHGYAVVSDSISAANAVELFVNVNDRTCEGIRYLDMPAMSVQFHPEACGGPQETGMLFHKFFDMIDDRIKA